jgi:hypothetical protein
MKSRMVGQDYDVELLCVLKLSITLYDLNIEKTLLRF